MILELTVKLRGKGSRTISTDAATDVSIQIGNRYYSGTLEAMRDLLPQAPAKKRSKKEDDDADETEDE